MRADRPSEGVPAPWWTRWAAGAVVCGAMLWAAAGLVIALRTPSLSPEDVYATVVPTALVLLGVGLAGVEVWLNGWTRPRRRRRRHRGLATAVLAMSSDRHEAVSSTGGHDGESPNTAGRRGLIAMRVGTVAIVVATLLLGDETRALRSLLSTGWFIFLAGVGAFAVAVIRAEEAPRWTGLLLLAGALLVLSPIAASLGGTRGPEWLGPLVPPIHGFSVLSLLLWLCLGAGMAMLGGQMWSTTNPPARPRSR